MGAKLKKKILKLIVIGVVINALSGCSPSITESLLICDGDVTSLISRVGGKEKIMFEITKTDEKITKVRSEYQTYTLEKVDARNKDNKGPVYIQLIVEPEKIILRTEITEDKSTNDTIIFNTGKYKSERFWGWAEGQCSVGKKAF